MKKRKNGYAMIMVICVMALALALCLAILLAASVVISSAQKQSRTEQCRILAVSLSQELENQLTDAKYTFSEPGEELSDGTLWFYMKENMQSGDWPYYNEGERGHTEKYAYRTYHFAQLPDELRDADVSVVMYWQSDSEAGGDYDAVPLEMDVTCTLNGQTCTVKSEYTLDVTPVDYSYIDAKTKKEVTATYDQWKWSLNWRE